MVIRVNDKEQIMFAGSELNDNMWHTIKIIRRGTGIRLQVDEAQPSLGISKSRLKMEEIHMASALSRDYIWVFFTIFFHCENSFL